MCFPISLAILTRWILITIYSPHRPNILELSKFYLKISFWHCYEDIFSGRPDPGLQLNLTRNHKKFTSTDFFAKVFVAALSGVSATYGRALQYCTRVSTTI